MGCLTCRRRSGRQYGKGSTICTRRTADWGMIGDAYSSGKPNSNPGREQAKRFHGYFQNGHLEDPSYVILLHNKMISTWIKWWMNRQPREPSYIQDACMNHPAVGTVMHTTCDSTLPPSAFDPPTCLEVFISFAGWQSAKSQDMGTAASRPQVATWAQQWSQKDTTVNSSQIAPPPSHIQRATGSM